MNHDLACMLCAIGPQATSMLLPIAEATVIAVPILFRENIVAAIQRARGIEPRADEEPDDDDDDSIPPGGVHP